MPKLDTLRVLANPYQYVDHEGRLAGVCPEEMIPNQSPRRAWIGATIQTVMLSTPNPSKGDYRTPLQDTTFVFSGEATTVLNTQYYRDRVRDCDVLATDEETATKCGVTYRDPKAVLAEYRDAAIEKWVANYGEPPAFAAKDGDK